jgi:glycosyltransferase involved in cell wall biosynthesis
MKIAYIYDCIYPYVKGGGEKRYYEIGKKLRDEHEVHFFGMKFWEGKDIIFKNGIYYHGVSKPKKLYIKSGRRSIVQAIYFGIKLIKPLFKEKFDLIDCSSFPFFSIFPCYIYSKIKKIPLAVTWHEYWDWKYWLKYLGCLGIFGYLIQKVTLLLSKNIIAVSGFTKNKLIKAGKNSKNIAVIQNGVNLDLINKISRSTEKSDIIFVGRLIKEKNVNLIIKALIKLKNNFKLIIIGEGPEKEKLVDLSKELNLENNIKFIDFQQNIENVYAYLKSSKTFILPSEREGFGMIVLEANACGLPVITINHRDNAAKDLIKDNFNGFVVNLSVKDIYRKVKEILGDKNNLSQISINSKKSVIKYDWNKITENIEKYYKNIINENNSNTS